MISARPLTVDVILFAMWMHVDVVMKEWKKISQTIVCLWIANPRNMTRMYCMAVNREKLNRDKNGSGRENVIFSFKI